MDDDMNTLCLVTGGTGHLGTNLVSLLLEEGRKVRVLTLDDETHLVPEGAECVRGDITDPDTLGRFFERDGYDRVSLFHCAGIVSLASGTDPRSWKVNVLGTEHILKQAERHQVERMVYVSSSHIIPSDRHAEELKEVNRFYPDELRGQYAKTKAAAANLVLDHAAEGLNVSLVHPTSLIGPGDRMMRNPMVRSLHLLAKLNPPLSVTGGYDVVDARDAAKGMILCEQYGKRGECYILSGHYLSVTDLINKVRALNGLKPIHTEVPAGLALAASYPAEWGARILGWKNPVFTPTSIETLLGNGHYSHAKAENELGYHPRDADESIRETLQEH